MFTQATYAVHAPALSLPEAAMLPALPKEQTAVPRNLILPDRRTYHPMPVIGVQPADHRKRNRYRCIPQRIQSHPDALFVTDCQLLGGHL